MVGVEKELRSMAQGTSPDIPTVIVTEDSEVLNPDESIVSGRLRSYATMTGSPDQSFGNSCQGDMRQQSPLNSYFLQHTLSTTIQFPPHSRTHSHDSTHTATLNRMQNTESASVYEGEVYDENEDAEEADGVQPLLFPKRKSMIGKSIRKLRSASVMSVSMLHKPSDDRKASSVLAGWNLSSLIQGTTILGIPYAVRQGGWAAVATILFIGFLTCHTGKILVDCMYETSKKSGIRRRLRITYPEIAEAALGKKGLVSMHIIQNSVMFGGVVMYIILLGTVWSDLMRNLTHLGIKEWEVINCCFSLPTLFITKMSIVSWFGMLSVFSIIIAYIMLITFSLTQIPMWDISNVPPFDIETFPIGYGIIMFSFCAHAVLPNIEGAMKKPESYNSMVNCSFSLASITKASLGVITVLRFGNNTAEVVTVNMRGHPIFSDVTSCLVIANVLLAMPLEMFVVSASYDNLMLRYFSYINKESGYYWVWLLISRPLLLTSALLVSVTVPRFGLLMGLIGSLTGPSLCFIFPCYCHLKLRWDALTNWQKVIDVSLILFGVFSGALGIFFSVKALFKT